MSEQNIVNTTMQAVTFQLLVAIFEQNAETTAAVLQSLPETQCNELIDMALTAESEEMLAEARQVFNEAFNALKEKAAQ
jgi:hypothetical protein